MQTIISNLLDNYFILVTYNGNIISKQKNIEFSGAKKNIYECSHETIIFI